jgi:hypothetical protein
MFEGLEIEFLGVFLLLTELVPQPETRSRRVQVRGKVRIESNLLQLVKNVSDRPHR